MGDILEKFNLNDSLAGPISSYEKTETKNAHRWCVLIFKPESESQQYANFCMRFANPEGKNTELLSELELRGYVCIKLRDTFENCQALGTKIQKFIQDRLPGSRLHCRVVKEYRLFFMKLSNVLIQFIADMCFSKSILCDHASEILFKETSLPEKLFFNRSLWIEIRYFVTYHLLMPTILSRKRGMNLVRFYWQNFDRLYTELLEKSGVKDYLFRISIQIVVSKKQLAYVVKNGFLCKILDFVSCNLKKLGFKRGGSISKVLQRIGISDIDPTYDLVAQFCEILHFSGKSINDSIEIKSALQKVTARLVQFSTEFDEMEPLTLMEKYQEVGIGPKDVYDVIRLFQNIFSSYIMMILQFDELANKTIEEFVEVFKSDMDRSTSNLSPQQALDKLITLPNIEKMTFSIFNFSKRFFFDLLTEMVVRRKLSDELKKKIFGDQMLLIWISQTAITSLSLEMYLKADRLVDCPNKLRSLVSDYHSPTLVHYLFMQDFNAIQFLMSFIGPEHFLKCLLFNICPSIREKVSISQSFASILSLPEFKDTLVLQQVLILIHNALSEMRIVGDLKDPDSYFMERQFNHMLASECKTETDLRTTVYMDRNSFRPIQLSRRNNKFGGLKVDSACNTENPQNETTQKLSPKYLNPGCPFYYLNTIKETEFAFESLLCYYKLQVPDFVLPGVTGLREEFKGLEAFMFSEAFLDFILECFVNWYKNPELWKKDSPDLFLFILLILCLILRVYKDRSIRESYRDRMFDFFGKHPKLENRSLLEIIKNEVPNCQNPLVAVMIDRFIDLSHLGKRNE